MHVFVFFAILAGCNAWSDNRVRSFKNDFWFGVSSSAYQIEGAWDADGKGESIWDWYTHNLPERIAQGVNGDEAADSYHLFRRDVQMLVELGVNFYRFSVSWTRILPEGLPNNINEKGLEYYDQLIDELLKHNITPMVTMNHFDLPQKLQELGGWANPWSQYWFQDYADIVFGRYAHKVQYWITINEPDLVCHSGYGGINDAPGLNSNIGEYLCDKYILLAHARAYRLYERKYKPVHKGLVSLSVSLNWYDPVNNKTENVEAAEIQRDFTFGMYVHPIFSKVGDFPPKVKSTVAKRSKDQGYPRSRLPEFTAKEINMIKGSADFLGISHYTTFLVQSSNKEFPVPSLEDDVRVELTQGEKWVTSASSWLRSAPYGLYRALIHLNLKYDYPTIIITEHGWSTDVGLDDEFRGENMKSYMKALLLALEDGTNCKGYAYWSLMDNVEWGFGTRERFGLYEVDFKSENKTRTPRLSAQVYKEIIKARHVGNVGY